jgi:hypothetical protein
LKYLYHKVFVTSHRVRFYRLDAGSGLLLNVATQLQNHTASKHKNGSLELLERSENLLIIPTKSNNTKHTKYKWHVEVNSWSFPTPRKDMQNRKHSSTHTQPHDLTGVVTVKPRLLYPWWKSPRPPLDRALCRPWCQTRRAFCSSRESNTDS